jgi:cell division protein FtsI/penicillin-binding protein 2
MIRLIIIITLIFIGVNVFGALFKSDGQGKVAVQKVEKKGEKKKHVKVPKNNFSPYRLSYSDVSEMVQKTDHRFEGAVDSVSKSGKTYLVHYSLDSSLQKLGTRLMKMYHPKYGAIVAVEPSTGRVLSLISYENDSVPKMGDELYCRSLFPAASVFKTITSAAAIEKANYSSQSIVRHVGKKSTLYKYQLVKDLTSFTELPFEEAFANSINPVFARIGMFVVGESGLEDYGSKFGFNIQVPFELPNESSRLIATDSSFSLAELASGFNQHTTMSPLFGALIASSICENGKMPRPFMVDSVSMNSDSCVYRAENELWRTPIKEGTARELRTMMQSVARYGTARKSFRLINQTNKLESIEYGGKTGSVDKDSAGRVDWFIGFARNPLKPQERIAIGVVTVHGAFWTVHSSYIAAEYFRTYIGSLRKTEQLNADKQKTIVKKDTGESPQPLKKS